MRRADSRADWTAGSNKATKTPMMAMTTNSSTSVKACRNEAMRFIGPSKESIRGGRGPKQDDRGSPAGHILKTEASGMQESTQLKASELFTPGRRFRVWDFSESKHIFDATRFSLACASG